MTRMGFEENHCFARESNFERITAVIGGKKYSYRSPFEYQWAQHLEHQKQRGEIKDWFYEPAVFRFRQVYDYPDKYRMDFLVIENNGLSIYQELKGEKIKPTAIKKLQRMNIYFPEIRIELVMMNLPTVRSQGANNRRIALKYVAKITNAAEVFEQEIGVIHREPPIIQEL